MFKKKQRKVSRSAGPNPIPIGYSKMIQWCLDNSIAVCVVPNWKGDNRQWQVEITINGRSNLDPKIYTGEEAQMKMYEYYKYYYDKNIQKSE